MLRTRLVVLSALLCALAGQMAAQKFGTINKKAGNGVVPTPGPNGDLYGTNAFGLFHLKPPAQAGELWSLRYLGVPGGVSEMVPVPGGTGFYVIGPGGETGSVDLISAPAAPATKWTQTAVYTFAGTPDGSNPIGNLILNADGSLYGVTAAGGQYGHGTVYQLFPPAAPDGAWTESILYSFGGVPLDGAGPQNLAIGSDGSLYGAADGGGTQNSGTVFQLTPPSAPGGSWQESTIYAFQGQADGDGPSDVVLEPSGALYGTTLSGGQGAGDGTAFALTPPSAPGGAWTKTTIFAFKTGNGEIPNSLVLGSDGNLYGTALRGGLNCYRRYTCGTVFELIPPASPGGTWTEKTIHRFAGNGKGRFPGGLSVGPNGTICGTTEQGGGPNGGTVFQIVP